MAFAATTKDCTQLSDSELSEMADLCAEGPGGYEIGTLNKQAEAWVLCTHVREGNTLRAFSFSTLERIGGTPAVLLGMAYVKRHSKRDQALKSLMGRDTVLNGAHATALYAEAAGVDAAPIFLHDHQGARAAELLAPGARWVAVAPGASKENKRWPAERLAEVARRLREDGCRVALLGGPMDGELLNIVRPHVDADLSSESLPVLASALKRVAVLIGNDSGLVHVAGAVGTPAVAIFGPTSVNRWGPQGKGVAVSVGLACAPCSNHGGAKCPLGHHDCLQKLDVERVLGAARALLR